MHITAGDMGVDLGVEDFHVILVEEFLLRVVLVFNVSTRLGDSKNTRLFSELLLCLVVSVINAFKSFFIFGLGFFDLRLFNDLNFFNHLFLFFSGTFGTFFDFLLFTFDDGSVVIAGSAVTAFSVATLSLVVFANASA